MVADKLDGSFPDRVKALSKRCKRKLTDDSAIRYNEKQMVLDLYDGAHHTNNDKKKEHYFFQLTGYQQKICQPDRINDGECQYSNMDAGTMPGKGRSSLSITEGSLQKQI